MSEVKGQSTITYVKQGDTLTCALRTTFPLKQFISNGNNGISPSFATNKPCIYPVIRSSLTATRISPLTTGYSWTYNGTVITFDQNGLSTAMGTLAAGTFKSEWKTVDGFGVPTLTILKEIASPANIDSDTLVFTGEVNTGFRTTVSGSIEISIEQTDGEAVLAYISINNGGVIDDAVSSLTATAHLLIGGVEKTSGVTYHWYKMVVVAGQDGWVSTGKTTKSITLSASDIASSELFRCVVTFNDKSAEDVIEVVDETDVLIIYPNPTDGNGNTVAEELNANGRTQIVYVPKVCKRGTGEQVSGFVFNYLLTNSSGSEIDSQDGGASFTVKLDHAKAANGNLTLLISASK